MFKPLAIAFTMLFAFGLHSSALKADAPSMTLGEILLADGNAFDSNQNDFDIVTQAILAFPELTAAAVNSAAELTVFLPTDKAFRILVEDTLGLAIKDEAELFDAIVAELTLPVVGAVLQYHIVDTVLDSSAVVAAGDGYVVETLLDGASFELDFKGRQIRLIDGEPGLRDPIVRVVDIHAVNGVAHVIDRVLIP